MRDELDKEMERQELNFVRYADDFSLFCKTKAEARKAGNAIYLYLRDKLKLPINREKSGIRRPVTFQVLGYGFVPTYRKGEKGKYQLVVTAKRWKAFKAKLKEITRKTTPMSLAERIIKLNSIQRGWINYFQFASMQQKLLELDGWLRNRIRYCIWHHCPEGIPMGEETRTEKKESNTFGNQQAASLCMEPYPNGRMGGSPKSHSPNNHHGLTSKAKRL